MKINHLFFVLLIMLMYGSAYPVGKIGTNLIPPLLMGSLRVLFLFILILPFFNFKIPRYNFSILIFFSVVMGFFVYGLLYLALDFSSLIAPIIIGTPNCLASSATSRERKMPPIFETRILITHVFMLNFKFSNCSLRRKLSSRIIFVPKVSAIVFKAR